MSIKNRLNSLETKMPVKLKPFIRLIIQENEDAEKAIDQYCLNNNIFRDSHEFIVRRIISPQHIEVKHAS